MRVAYWLILLLSYSLAAPAHSQNDQPEAGDPEAIPSVEQPTTQMPRGGLFGLFRGPPLRMGTSPLQLAGDIDQDDGVDRDLQLKYEDFRIIFEAGQRVRISAMSLDMDPQLRIFAPGGSQLLMHDQDSGPGSNARLIFTPPQPGMYIVRVVGTIRGLNGPYRLTIEPAQSLPDAVAVDGAAVAETTRWSEFSGELSTQDASIEGLYFDDYRVTVAADRDMWVRVDSPDFDPVVQIFAAVDREGDSLASDDDSGPGRNSLLVFRRPEAGEYIIRITTFSDRVPVGHYTLRVGR